MVRAEILMRPEGRPCVRLEPASVGTSELLQLVLCYGAKLRWSLDGEAESVRDAFERLTWEAAVMWDVGYEARLLDWLPAKSPTATPAEITDAPRHERYLVQLYSDERGRGYPCGSPPANPRRANLVSHFLALLEAVSGRLDQEGRAATQGPLLRWWREMFRDPRLPTDAPLNRHVAVANGIVAEAGDALDTGLVSA